MLCLKDLVIKQPAPTQGGMISYVECLGGEGAGPGVASRCWNTGPDEERDELLPRKMAALQPKTEGSLRRRLLSAKLHQHHDAIWGKNAGGVAGRPGTLSGDRKTLPSHLQYSGNSPWYRPQHLPPRPHIHPSFTPEAHGKLFLAPEANGKSQYQSPPIQLQRSTCPVLTQRRRTSSCPPTPEPRPGYTLSVPSPLSSPTPLKEPEVPPQYRYRPSRRRRHSFFSFRWRRGRGSRLEATQTTPLLNRGDRDSKWSVHYTTQKPQQGLVFIPGKRRSGNADDLQECNVLTQHGCGRPPSSHLHQQSPASPLSSSGPDQSEGSTRRRWKDTSQKMSSASSDEDERFILNNMRPLTPLVLNPVHLNSSWNVFAPAYEPTIDVEMEPAPRLPTPEERMRQQAEAVPADIVPINITGESFDRQASFRRIVSNSDSLSRRPRNLSRRKTVTGIPDDVHRKLDSPLVSSVLPGQFSTVGRPASTSCTSTNRQKNTEEEMEKTEMREIRRKEGQLSARRIRAPRGEGMSSLMASLTTSHNKAFHNHSTSCCSSSSEVHSLPRLETSSSLNSEASCNSASYRTLSTSPSCCQSQDVQDFSSDLQPLLPFDLTSRGPPQSPISSSSSSFPSSPVTSSLPSTPCRALQTEWSYPSDKPLNDAAPSHSSLSSPHYFSSSSIADLESQFSYQALDDQNTTQQDVQFSYDGQDRWNYQPLSSSSSVNSGQTGVDWNGITQETRCVPGEGWSCEPLLSSGRSSPAFADSSYLCSEKDSSSRTLNWEKRKSSTSSSYSHTVARSISLRKSKRPPPPPLRSDSLRRRPGRSKSSRSPSSPRQEHSPHLDRTTQRTPTSSAQTFHDPWVPRGNTKRRQSGLNCGTVTTFEPLNLDCQAAASADCPLSKHLPPSPVRSHAHIFTPGSPGSEEEGLRLNLNPQPAACSVAGLQRLASPSSGYSSQSNTPIPGTPVSSPLTPSSPLAVSPGAFSLPPTSPFSSSQSSAFPPSVAVSSLPKTRSRGEGRPKPPVPERKSSLFSSISSSFSSTSSLSSYTSSDSSAKHPLLPAPPPPPPLPECSSLSSHVFYSPIYDSPPPAPPPLHSCPTAPPSFTKLSAAPPSPPSSLPPPPLPPPPPPPPLPPSSLPTPPPLPPSSRPPPPPYSYAVRQASQPSLVSTVSSSNNFSPSPSSPPLTPSSPLPSPSELPELPVTDLPPPPPPPPLPPLTTLQTSLATSIPPPILGRSPNRCVKVGTPPCLLVTAQALQAVRLRSVKNQEVLVSSIMVANATSADATLHSQADNSNEANTKQLSKEATTDNSVLANINLEILANTDVKIAGTGTQNPTCNLGSNEADITSTLVANASLRSPGYTTAKQFGHKLDHYLYNLTKSDVSTPSNESSYANPESLPGIVPSSANQKSSGPQVTTPQDVQPNEQEQKDSGMYATLVNDRLSCSDSPWMEMSYNADKNHFNTNIQHPSFQEEQVKETMLADAKLTDCAEKWGNTVDVFHTESSYLTLSQAKQESCRESRAILSESKDDVDTNDKNNRSPDKPILPKKPDLCILSQLASPEARQGPGRWKSSGQITSPSSGPKKQSQLPSDSPCTNLQGHPTDSRPSPTHLTRSTADKTSTPEKSLTDTKLPAHSVTTASLQVNTTPADILANSPASSPQKLPMLQKKLDFSLRSPRATKPLIASRNPGEAPKGSLGTCNTLEISAVSQTQTTTGISTPVFTNTFNGTMGTTEDCGTSVAWGTIESSPLRTSVTLNNLGNSGPHRAASTQTGSTQIGATDPCCTEITRTRLHEDDEKTFHKRMMRSSLAEDEDEEEDEREKVEQKGIKTKMMMMMKTSTTKKKDKARKRRKRRVGRQLLMMSSTMEPSLSSSSSSSSSSSEDERDVVKERTMRERVRITKVCDQETSDSDSSCALIGQSRYSLSSALSTDSLRGELSLPDLLIRELEEEGTQEDAKEVSRPQDADMFVSVSADQMFISSRPRTTEDLFAVIHRSKRKMLGRRDSEEGRHPISSSSSSSSSPPATPTDPLPRPMRPAALRNQRSMRSESFKALLLRKGSRSDSCSRISAVERLRKAAPPMTTGPDHQRSLSLPQRPDQPHVRPTSLSHTTDTHDINAHMTLDIPASPPTPCSHNLSVMLGLRQRDLTHSHLLFTSSTSPFFFLPSSSSMRPRSLTPPCSGSRRLAARCRLYATPMTAIFEGEGEEEEEDDEVFVESPGSLLGTEAELGQRLVEIS